MSIATASTFSICDGDSFSQNASRLSILQSSATSSTIPRSRSLTTVTYS